MLCENCGKVFKSNKELKRHISEIHADTVTIHKCEFCERPFTKRCNLKRHLKTVHKMETTSERLAESTVSVNRDNLDEMKKPVFLLNPDFDMVSDDEFDKVLSDEDDADFEDCDLSDPNEWMRSGEDVENLLDELLGENAFAGDEKVKTACASSTTDASHPRSEPPRENGNTMDASRSPHSGEEEVTLSRTISIDITVKTSRKPDGSVTEERKTTVTCKGIDAKRLNIAGVMRDIAKELQSPENVQIIDN